MTEEELEKEAEEKAKEYEERKHYRYEDNDYCGDIADGIIQAYEQAALDFAEPREKRIADLEKENAELKEELKKWKDEWQEQVQKAIDEGYARTQQTIQLTKAKEIMNIAIEGIKHWGIVGGTERPFEKQAELEFNLFLEKAEQFLKCENIILEDAQAGNSPFDADEVFNKEMKAYPEENVKKEKEK